ncbi:MAG: hypothetical protein RR063_10185, partial [Anaerovoracaceae bacterium]
EIGALIKRIGVHCFPEKTALLHRNTQKHANLRWIITDGLMMNLFGSQRETSYIMYCIHQTKNCHFNKKPRGLFRGYYTKSAGFYLPETAGK